MKKTTLRQAALRLALVALAVLSPLGLRAQETLPLYETASDQNQYVPFYGYYGDEVQTNQLIYPASELSDMDGGEITQMVFYVASQSGNNTLCDWVVSIGETSATTLSGIDNTTTLTQVYSGAMTFGASSGATTMTIVFDQPYTYNGGNLLIQFNNPVTNSSAYHRYYFTGIEATGASYCYGDQEDFLPKVTFTYEPAATSGTPKPTGFAVNNILHNQADLSWNENGTATSWQICVNGDEENLITATTNPFTLTGLTPLTAYTVKVRSVGSPNSDWSTARSFTTTAQATIVGDSWSDDFEGASCGWELINGTPSNKWCWGTATSNGGTHSLYVSNDNGATTTYDGNNTKIFATKLLQFADGKYEFSFDWLCKGESTYDFLRVALVPASITLTAGTDYNTITQPGLPSGWIALDGGKLNLQQSWQNKSVAINVAAGNYYMVLAWRNETGAYPPAAAVDNVSITKVACDYDVEGLAVGNITTTTADIAWTNSEAGSWQVAVKAGAGEWEILPSTYNSNGATLTLVPSTSYQVKVRAYCDADHQGSWCNPISFATECDVISAVGYSENFDSYTTGNNVLPICWSYINTTTTSYYQAYPKIYNYSANSPSNCLYFYSYYSSSYDPQPQYAILPEMSDLTGKRITLQARGYNTSSTFRVGTMSDPTDASSFTEVTNTDNPAAMTTSYQEYFFDIPSTTDRYVAIMIEAANSTRTTIGVYIDDIVFSVSPSCYKPTEAHADVQDANNATISWTPDSRNTAGGSYSILDAELNVVPGAEQLTGTSFTLTGLTESHDYTYYVQTNCFNTEENVDNVEVTFTTPADCGAPILAADAFTNVSAHQATVSWTGYTSNLEYVVSYRSAAYLDGITEEFATSIPEGWTMYTGLLVDNTATLSEATYGWSFGSGNGVFDNHARVNIYSNNQRWLVTPAITIPNNAVLDFDMALTNYNGNLSAPATTGTDDKFIVLISTDNMSTWTTLREWNNSGSAYVYNEIAYSATGENVNIDLSSYAGQSAYIAFYGESTQSNADNNLHIDNVAIGAAIPAGAWQTVTPNPTTASTTLTGLTADTPYEVKVKGICNGGNESEESDIQSFKTTIACPAPTNLASANVTAHTADLTWNVNGSVATSWVLTVNGGDIEINSSAVTITNGVASYTLTGLDGETEYTVSVVANCGTDDGTSLPSNEVSFTTQISCYTPTLLTVTDSTTSTMTLSWTNGSEGQDAWVIDYKKAGDAEFTTKNVTTNPYTLGELEDGKSYTLRIRANCGEIDGLSQWSSEITHATEASCQTPTDITVSDVDGHGATISWTDPTVAGKSYIVMVASENMALNVDFENSSIPSNFTNDDNYPWYVYTGEDCTTKAMRSSNNGVNNSTSAIEVTVNVTAASTLSFDFWSRGEGTSTLWDKSIFYIDGVQQFERGETSAWENYSAPIAVGSHTLKWVYTKDGTTHKTGDCFYVDNIKITAGASEFVERPATTEHSLVIDDLDPETTYYVKVKGDCGSATSPESDVESFTTLTACNVPTNLTHDDESVDAHTATLSWTENNGATAWQVVYSKANINNSELTVDIDENDVNIDGTTITYTLIGLDGETGYIVRVKSNCGGVHNDMSNESNSTIFTTLPACYPVGDVITSDITAYSVTVHWTDANNAGAYVIKQGENVLDGTTTPSVVIDAENHSAVISGLEPQHTYTNGTFKVFANCGSEGMSATGTNVPYFQTEPSCYPVTNVTITGKTATSVTFTWEDTHNPETYVIKEGENVLTGETAHSVDIDAENHTATISGLDENETYAAGTFKVFADCGTIDGQSVGVNVPAFTTPCSAHTTFPWTEDFNSLSVANSIPDCWNNDEGTTSNASYKWCYTTATSGNGACNGTSYDGSKCVRFNSYYGSHVNYLKSIPLSLPTDQTMQLKFWYKNPTGGDFSVYISTDGGATHETALATGLTGVSDWTEHDPISLSAYAGQEVVLVFKGTSNNGSGNAYIYLDDVTVEEAPACAAPSALNATAITNNSATLSWTANSGEDAWTLYYKKTSEENYTEVTENVTNPYTLTVEASTEYIFYVVANCDESSESDPSATFTFTTKCDPMTITADVYIDEDFESYEGKTYNVKEGVVVPDCWDKYSESTTYVPHVVSGSSYNYYHSGSQSLNFIGDGSNSAYVALPTFTNDLNELMVKFWMKTEGTGSNYKLSLGYITAADVNYNTYQVIEEYDNTTTVTERTTYLSTKNVPAEAARLVFRFYHSGYSWHACCIDDLVVKLSSVEYTVDANSWYAISSPVSTPVVTSVDNLIATGTEKYDFFRYNETNATWENYKVHDFGFENGRGYIYRRTNDATLTFTGTPNNGNDIPVNLTYTEAMDEHLRGFNLIGNPYTTEYALGRACYSLNTNGTWAAQPSSYLVQPFEAVMVQADEAGTYTFTNGSSKDAPKAVEALAIKVNGNGFEDVTYAMLENGKGLNKINHLAEEAPALSIAANGSNYAIAYLGYEVESFPLTLNAQAGTYTIALNSQISSLSYVHLIDNLTGKDIDLLSNAYTFTTDGNSANRFLVKLSPSSLQATEGEIATWNGNSWTVKGEGTLQLFDVMGRKVLSQEVSELSTINTDHLSSGVYVIRLGEKSQKIVVK